MLAPLWKTSRWLTLAVLAGTAVTACASGADSSPDPDEAGVDLADSSQAITLCTTDGMACSVTTRETGVCVNGSCCTGCVNRVLIGTKGACAVGDSLTMCGSGGDACRNCDDNNPCTADACTAKGCTHTIVEGSCSGGVCVQGQCCTGCIDGDGNCQKGLSPDGCGRGGGKCTTCFDRQPCTFDLCLEGSCQYPQKDDNTSCESDKDVCNGESICRGGKCVAGTPLNCDDNNPCTDDKCDPAAGCQKSPIEGSCNDGDPCTISDTCVEGSCKGGATATCNDNEVCTQDLCDSTGSGCKNVPIDQGKDCDDGNSCSTASICDNGKCVTTAGTACDDNNPCTRNRCTGGAGCYYTDLEPVNTPCIPANNKCVLNATCNETGACTGGEEKSCDDNNPCTEEHCDPQSGECVSSKLNTGECNDGSACTVDDSCQDGVCQGTAKECPTVQCFAAGKCDAESGNCSYSPLRDGASCENDTGTCSKGTCVPNPIIDNTAGAGGEGGVGPVPVEGGSGNQGGATNNGGESTAAGESALGGTTSGTVTSTGGRSSGGSTTSEPTGDRGEPFKRDPGGCSCSVPGPESNSRTAPVALSLSGLLATLIAVRRRRRS